MASGPWWVDCIGSQHGADIPQVVGAACGDRTQAVHDANLFDINAKIADVVEAEEAIEMLKTGKAPRA